MKKIRLRAKETGKELGIELSKKDIVESWDDQFIVINQIPAYFRYEQRWIPTLKFLQQRQLLKKITVDMGAVKFVVNGADIMRPGIVAIEDGIAAQEAVVIIDVQHHKALAVGLALYDSKEMQEIKTGKVIKNLHYVGDEIWKK